MGAHRYSFAVERRVEENGDSRLQGVSELREFWGEPTNRDGEVSRWASDGVPHIGRLGWLMRAGVERRKPQSRKATALLAGSPQGHQG